MTLEQKLSRMEPTQRIYIGSETAFFFAGTVETFYTEKDSLEKKLFEDLKFGNDRAKMLEQSLKDPLLNDKKRKEYKTRIKNLRAKYKAWEPLLDRKVERAYMRISDPGAIALVLTGGEKGKIWFEDEEHLPPVQIIDDTGATNLVNAIVKSAAEALALAYKRRDDDKDKPSAVATAEEFFQGTSSKTLRYIQEQVKADPDAALKYVRGENA